MIRYFALIFILASGYYTFTYGKSLWVDDKNKLGGVGAVLLAVMSIMGSIGLMFIKT